MVNRSQGADNRPRSGSTVAQLWRGKLPAIVAKHSPVDANPRHRLVAIGIAGSGRLGTIALQVCDRGAAGAVRSRRNAEVGRQRKQGRDAFARGGRAKQACGWWRIRPWKQASARWSETRLSSKGLGDRRSSSSHVWTRTAGCAPGRVGFGLSGVERRRLLDALAKLRLSGRAGRGGVRWVGPAVAVDVEHHGSSNPLGDLVSRTWRPSRCPAR